MRIALIICSLLVLTIGCRKKAEMNKEFTLNHGQTAVISTESGKLFIKYTDLTEESRCPPDVNCVSAGNARVKLQFDKGTAYALGLQSNEDSFIYLLSYKITLLEVGYDKDKNFAKERHSYVKILVE